MPVLTMHCAAQSCRRLLSAIVPRCRSCGLMNLRMTCRIRPLHRPRCRYSDATQRVNAVVTAELARQRRVRIVDCDYEALLLTPDRRSVQPQAMPDGIHPSAQAWDFLATACLDADVAQFLSTR